MGILLAATAAALPAFIAALGGIMFQSEARRLELRSESMHDYLSLYESSLERHLAALEAPAELRCGGEVWRTAEWLRSLAGIMLAETSDWAVLYQTHEIHAG